LTDKTESDALSFRRDIIDIYTQSWGPDDDGKMMDAPRIQGQRAIDDGIRYGRNGKGSLFVWGSGNGYEMGDNCGADGYANSMYTILFAAADFTGKRARYSGKFKIKGTPHVEMKRKRYSPKSRFFKVKGPPILIRNKFSVFVLYMTKISPNNIFMLKKILQKSESKVWSDLGQPTVRLGCHNSV